MNQEPIADRTKPCAIAIDGPAGAGKSTIAKAVAKTLNFTYIDTGAMYRTLAVFFLRKGIDRTDEDAIVKVLPEIEVGIDYQDGVQQLYLNGENVTGLIRTEEVGKMASASSAYKKVREKLVEQQQMLAMKQDVVMDGRDIGTVVLPNADLKVYLTASAHVRALRRAAELEAKGETVDVAAIERDIEQRDYNDSHRENSPLMQAEDAVLVDSSDMTIEEVTQKILELYRERG